jgi:signal transduction histidine kinase
VSRELHDELGGVLSSINLALKAWLKDLPAPQRRNKKAASITRLTEEAIRSVRRISTELRPGVLDDLGLAAAIDWVAQEFEAHTQIECRPNLSEIDLPLDRDRDTAVFRILQESLTNIARHAHATCVDIELGQDPAGLTLEVRDNGRGATLAQLQAPSSLGIRGMRERALLLSGDLAVHSSVGRGTTVQLRIPLILHEPGA